MATAEQIIAGYLSTPKEETAAKGKTGTAGDDALARAKKSAGQAESNLKGKDGKAIRIVGSVSVSGKIYTGEEIWGLFKEEWMPWKWVPGSNTIEVKVGRNSTVFSGPAGLERTLLHVAQLVYEGK